MKSSKASEWICGHLRFHRFLKGNQNGFFLPRKTVESNFSNLRFRLKFENNSIKTKLKITFKLEKIRTIITSNSFL